jgi:hypothetical protein
MTVKLTQSDNVKGVVATPYPASAGEMVSVRASITVPATAALNDIFELVQKPVGTRLVDCIIDCDDLDAGTTITLDVGFMSGTPGDKDITRTVGTEILSASNVGQAGGSVRPTAKTAFRDTASDTPVSIGMLIHAAATTPQAGTFGITCIFAAD